MRFRPYQICGETVPQILTGDLVCVLGMLHFGEHQDAGGTVWVGPDEKFPCLATISMGHHGETAECVLDRDHANRHRSRDGSGWGPTART